MIGDVNMATDLNKLRYMRKAKLYDELIELDIAERKSTPRIIAFYANIICDKKNPYNKAFLDRLGINT